MSQAQPRPPRPERNQRRNQPRQERPGPDRAERQERAARGRSGRAGPNAPAVAGRQARSNARGSRPLLASLLPFLLGLAAGYGLSGPLPRLAEGAMAALLHGQHPLATLVNPLLIGERRLLVLGTDKVADNTDVMFTVQVKNGITEVMQVPRDTFIESEKFGVVKANSLYVAGGIDTAKREIGQLLQAPVDRYLSLNLQAVRQMADALGGVEVDVPKRMYYVDNAQGLYIDLYPGPQLLKGESLEGFLRFRHDELGDIGRLERQKLVMRQVFAKLAQPSSLAQLPALLKIAGNDVKTDLSPLEMGQLLTAMAGTRLHTAQLPGRLFWHNELSYWMPDANSHYAGVSSSEPPP